MLDICETFSLFLKEGYLLSIEGNLGSRITLSSVYRIHVNSFFICGVPIDLWNMLSVLDRKLRRTIVQNLTEI